MKTNETKYRDMFNKSKLRWAITNSGPDTIYKEAILFAAMVRRDMDEDECRRVSAELIMDTEVIE